jgi:4,5-dihydroxyphthalate decarboxylase
MQIPISIAIGDYDRTRDLLSGRVSIDGAQPNFIVLEPEEIFHRTFKFGEFDVCEMSLSSYVLQVARGLAPYWGLPIFLSRMFRHNGIYIRADSGINQPSDLRGRRVGCPEYQLTACVWVRGFLQDQFGVHWTEIEWVRGGIEQPGRAEKLAFELPDGLRLTQAEDGKSLTDMLVEGSIDALVAPRRPSAYIDSNSRVSWLFKDPWAVALDYHKQTRAFPIMHLLGVRKELVDRHPWLPSSIAKAFSIAKDQAVARLEDTAASKVTLPFMEEYTKRSRETLGGDIWPYGATPNLPTLETFLRYHHEQGLSPRLVTVDELFHPASADTFKI